MGGFLAIYKRELRHYFTTLIGYIAIAVVLAFAGYPFSEMTRSYSDASSQYEQMMMMSQGRPMPPIDFQFTQVFSSVPGMLTTIFIFVLPFLTMRLFAEEKKQGTMELLLTYPISDLAVTLGKYFACCTFLLVMLLPTLLYIPIGWWLGAAFELDVVLAQWLGLALMGMAFIALGMWCSSMTENQIVAAAVSLGIGLFLFLGGISARPGNEGFVAQLIVNLSLMNRVRDFMDGVIDTRHVVYYVSFAFVFVFLTLRTLESKKWRS